MEGVVFMKDVLDLLDKEASKLPKVSKKTHDAEFAMMKKRANRKSNPDKRVKTGPKRDPNGRTLPSEHKRRLDAYLKHKGDWKAAAYSIGLNLPTFKGWFSRYGKDMLKEQQNND